MQYEILRLNLQSRRALRQNVIIYKSFNSIQLDWKQFQDINVYLMFSINFKRCLYFKFDTDFKQDGVGGQQKLKLLDNAQKIFHTLIKVPAGKTFTTDDCGKRRRFASVILLYVGLFVHHYILCFNHTACQHFLTRACIHHIPKRLHKLRDESLFIICVRLVRKWLTSVAAVINMKEGVSKCVSSVSLIMFHPLVLCLMLSFFSAHVHVEQ